MFGTERAVKKKKKASQARSDACFELEQNQLKPNAPQENEWLRE